MHFFICWTLFTKIFVKFSFLQAIFSACCPLDSLTSGRRSKKKKNPASCAHIINKQITKYCTQAHACALSSLRILLFNTREDTAAACVGGEKAVCVCLWNCGIRAHDDCDCVADNDEYVVIVCVWESCGHVG